MNSKLPKTTFPALKCAYLKTVAPQHLCARMATIVVTVTVSTDSAVVGVCLAEDQFHRRLRWRAPGMLPIGRSRWSSSRTPAVGGTTVDSQGLTDRRAAAVRRFLVDNGFHNVTTRVRDDSRGSAGADPINKDAPADRRVDLLVDGGGRMNTATHGFGHAFGMDDEYAHATTAIGDTAHPR